ncbi:MAG: hypothetical protein QOF53_3993 [Nocardioidaceae bacterium]|nr:hypothetical protein [Nocardioidaceae bacterium]
MSYQQAVWAWNQHLRAGGVTPWREWLRTRPEGGGTDDPHVPAAWVPPGAAQLEFVRLAALLGAHDPRFVRLADLATGRSGPGRGLAQQPLWWPPDVPGRRFGAPPVDPSQVPAEELVRVGVGALVELLLAVPEPPPRVRRRSRTARWRSGYVVEGAPVTRSALRRSLAEQGYAEGGRRPRVLLAVEPFDDLLAQVWSARVQRGAAVRWHGFVRRWAGRAALPPAADLPALARSWADRVGVDRVHVLVGADSSFDPAAAVRPAGRREEGVAGPEPEVRDLSPAAVDVLRRVNAVLSVRVAPERQRSVLPGLVDDLARVAPPGPGLTVPPPFQDWARSRAERIADELRSGDYPVHGSLEGILPRVAGLRTHPSRQDALAVVLAACLRQVR